MKKALSLIIAIVMFALMAVSVSAATVEIPTELSGHTFTAYQIFTATDDTDGTLTDVDWGEGLNSANFLAALKASDKFVVNGTNIFASASSAEDVAKALSDNTGKAKEFAALAYNHINTAKAISVVDGTTLNPGYYLMVDASTDLDTDNDNADDFAYNAALLQVSGDEDDITITAKTDLPIVEKKVVEEDYKGTNDTSTYGYSYGDGYNDVADYDMGDTVPFALYSKVPDMTYYESYKMVFHDIMSDGLELKADSFVVTVGNTTLNSSEYTVNTNPGNGETFTVTIKDLKKVANVTTGLPIVVKYNATLTQNAVVGLDGNPNEVYLQYTNNPNDSAPEVDTNGDGVISGDEENSLGTTVHDYVIVFTYELDVTKVDGDNTSTLLKDAEFYLKGSGDKGYAILDANKKITGWSATQNGATKLVTDASGKIAVIGLDDGTYYLEEVKAPTGYNALSEAVTVVLTATTDNGQDWTTNVASDALEGLTVTADGTAGQIGANYKTATVTVANFKGSTLPETGGIGTTIFYIVGGLLMFGAVVFLVARKRTSAED